MPKLEIQGQGQFEVPSGTRLIKALVDIANTDQLHACGGKSRCTSCRVKFISGQSQQITQAERDTLREREISDPDVRLSCQILCNSDMHIELISRLEGSGRSDQGLPCSDQIEPDPVWAQRDEQA